MYNRIGKSDEFPIAIVHWWDENGIGNFKIVPTEDSENPIQVFSTYASARERLDKWVDEEQLCLSHCGLTEPGSICFNHQIKQCKGICAGLESVELYNKRVAEIIARYEMPFADFAIFEKGRHSDERAVIFVEDSKYVGFGYFDSSEAIQGKEHIRNLVSKEYTQQDASDLVRNWIKRNKNAKIVRL
jgi:DNA polymerase-3 subunit epsilon